MSRNGEDSVQWSPTTEQQVHTALAGVRKAAEAGNPEAQFRLGVMYADADLVSLDYGRAAHWVGKAAAQGMAKAQALLAWFFANGLGVEQDDAEAGRWYLKAAAQGLPREQCMVATMYRFGTNGFRRDLHAMLDWYRRAADQGYAPAQYALGKLLLAGKLVERDTDTAFQWLSLAAANGSKGAEKALFRLMDELGPESVQRAMAAVRSRSSNTAD